MYYTILNCSILLYCTTLHCTVSQLIHLPHRLRVIYHPPHLTCNTHTHHTEYDNGHGTNNTQMTMMMTMTLREQRRRRIKEPQQIPRRKSANGIRRAPRGRRREVDYTTSLFIALPCPALPCHPPPPTLSSSSLPP
jgi:hypothetical protein